MSRHSIRIPPRFPILATLLVAAGCSVVTPPPMRMLHEPVLRTDPGGVSVAAIGGGGAGVFLDGSAGGEARVSVQASREMDVELSGGFGGRVEDNHGDDSGVPKVLGWGRAGGRYRPDRIDWFSLRFGTGGGAADTGLAYLTTDVGVSFGYSFRSRVRPYGGISLALSVPVVRGPAVQDEDGDLVARSPATTLWIGAGAGVSVRIVRSLEIGVEGLLDLGWAPSGDSAIAFGGTCGIRYTFGPVRRDRPRDRPDEPIEAPPPGMQEIETTAPPDDPSVPDERPDPAPED